MAQAPRLAALKKRGARPRRRGPAARAPDSPDARPRSTRSSGSDEPRRNEKAEEAWSSVYIGEPTRFAFVSPFSSGRSRRVKPGGRSTPPQGYTPVRRHGAVRSTSRGSSLVLETLLARSGLDEATRRMVSAFAPTASWSSTRDPQLRGGGRQDRWRVLEGPDYPQRVHEPGNRSGRAWLAWPRCWSCCAPCTAASPSHADPDFGRGTEQHAHSDAMHFSSVRADYVRDLDRAGGIDEDNGRSSTTRAATGCRCWTTPPSASRAATRRATSTTAPTRSVQTLIRELGLERRVRRRERARPSRGRPTCCTAGARSATTRARATARSTTTTSRTASTTSRSAPTVPGSRALVEKRECATAASSPDLQRQAVRVPRTPADRLKLLARAPGSTGVAQGPPRGGIATGGGLVSGPRPRQAGKGPMIDGGGGMRIAQPSMPTSRIRRRAGPEVLRGDPRLKPKEI